MTNCWIRRRETQAGKVHYQVAYRLGGRSTRIRYARTFKTKREALARKSYVALELAAMRVPVIGVVGEPSAD